MPCPGGKYCEKLGLSVPTGDCFAGYYCNEKAKEGGPLDNVQGNYCPVGYYCPSGVNKPLPCLPGTYR